MNAPLLNAAPQANDERTPLAFVLYANRFCTMPTSTKSLGGWAAFCAQAASHDIREQKDGPAFSLVQLKPGAPRKNENVESLSGISIDSDQGIAPEDGLKRVDGYRYHAWSTHSSAETHPKFRVVLPFLRPVSAEEWPFLFAGARQTFGEDLIDPACKDPARLYYLPSCPPERQAHAWIRSEEGELLDPAPLIVLGRQLLAPGKTPEAPGAGKFPETRPPWLPPTAPDLNADLTAHAWPKPPLSVLIDAAPFIDPDQPYPGWFGLGAAIHDATEGSDAGLQLFDDISAGRYRGQPAVKYAGRAVIEKLWHSYDSQREPRITAGTYLQLARRGGWRSPSAGLMPMAPLYLLDHPIGDRTNGKLFADCFRDRLIFNSSSKRWMKHDDSVWDECQHGEEMAAAKTFADRILDEAAALYKATPEDDPKRSAAKQWMKAAQRLQEKQELKDMLELAQSEPGMTVTLTEFDQDPYLLNVRNGVVDLRTGSLLQSSPRMLLSRRTEASYDPAAQCPLFLQTLAEVFQHDQAMIDSFQLCVGYSATGDVSEEKMMFLFGHGANGKTLVCNIIEEVLGTYCVTAPSTLLEVRSNASGSGPRPDLARLAGARLAMASETSPGRQWDSQLIKQVASNERQTERFLYGDYFEFQPTAKLWVRGNHKPEIRDNGYGLWRRMILFPFERQFAEHEQDHGLLERLRAERDGILRWMVDGAVRWWRGRQSGATGLVLCPKISAAINEYRDDCDIVGQWVSENCKVGSTESSDGQDLYDNFVRWCAANGRYQMTKQALGRQLAERGFVRQKTSSKVRWRGIGLDS